MARALLLFVLMAAPLAQGQGSLPDAPGNSTGPCGSRTIDSSGVTFDSSSRCKVSPVETHSFLDPKEATAVTPGEKLKLAAQDVFDPVSMMAITGNAAIIVAARPHNANGPGFPGFGRETGYSFAQAATGEFIGTFAIASLVHEDPYYHRMPYARPMRRLLHAISRTVIARHDDGTSMPNYEILLTYPACAVISSQYVPGLRDTFGSTMRRIGVSYGTDPIGNIVNEFLPDVARHVHLHIGFADKMLEQVVGGQPVTSSVAIGCIY